MYTSRDILMRFHNSNTSECQDLFLSGNLCSALISRASTAFSVILTPSDCVYNLTSNVDETGIAST